MRIVPAIKELESGKLNAGIDIPMSEATDALRVATADSSRGSILVRLKLYRYSFQSSHTFVDIVSDVVSDFRSWEVDMYEVRVG